MADGTKIEWTQATWNPVRGCSKISAGCEHCYAQRFAERWRGVPGHPYEQGFDIRLVPEALEWPARWKCQRLVFVNSMSDLFHEAVPESYIRDVFSTMALEDRHIYQVLTKRTSRLRALVQKLPWLQHVWMGVTVESAAYLDRIDDLRAVPAPIRFLSLEPLLGPVRPDLTGIHWVIVGGESGPGARALEPSWARAIRDLCLDAGVPFFFKQWGGTRRARAGRILDGRVWNEYPRMRGNAE